MLPITGSLAMLRCERPCATYFPTAGDQGTESAQAQTLRQSHQCFFLRACTDSVVILSHSVMLSLDDRCRNVFGAAGSRPIGRIPDSVKIPPFRY